MRYRPGMNSEKVVSALLIILNLVVIGVMALIAWALDGLGPDFVFGGISGAVLVGLYLRLKLGYWP